MHADAACNHPGLELGAQPVRDIRTGCDLLYIPRLEALYRASGSRFFLRVLHDTEWAYCTGGHARHVLPRAAARIALKEALAKALGCGLNGLGWGAGVRWHDIEVQSREKQVPQLVLRGSALEKQQSLGICDWRLSVSHDGDYAFASVIGVIR